MKTNLLQKIMRILLGGIMVFAGISHLTFQRVEFQAQVPRWLTNSPAFMDFVVVASGIVEIVLGLAMVLLWKQQIKVGIALAIFFILVFPGNVSQYTNQISAFGLDTDQKRLIRLFFQPLFIFLALWSTGGVKYLWSRAKK